MMIERIRRIYWYLEIIPRLGIWNVFYVLYYRFLLRSGFHKRSFPVQSFGGAGSVYSESPLASSFPEDWKASLMTLADKIIGGHLPYYSYHWMEQPDPPNWFLNPVNGKESVDLIKHWTQIQDFNKELGDIKNVWETSRFSWLGILARAYAVSGKTIYLSTINRWLADWMEKNPVNQGPNWKCGQEASYRVFSLLNAANLMNQADRPSELLVEMIDKHLGRISSNIRYAFAQRNNHATSEAAALYIGGNWLRKVNDSAGARAERYASRGRKALESLVVNLTYEDGSFAQHSVVYHRLFLDTLSLAVYWTRKLDLPDFTPRFYERSRKALHWLFAVCDDSGDCPNLGSNDGTLLMDNHSCDYRDFRPSLQMAATLLENHRLYDAGPHDEPLFWSGNLSDTKKLVSGKRSSSVFLSGYVLMNAGESWAMLRFPYFRFRPAHNDTFHFDLWANGRNLLFDSGSYSYNPDKNSVVPDLKSVHSHNSLSFDGKEQMPRLGRFLLGKWLKPESISEILMTPDGSESWEGSYKDAAGNFHERKIKWSSGRWEIFDQFRGKAAYVEIGFNFDQCEYSIEGDSNTLILPWGRLSVTGEARTTVRNHMASQYYSQSMECYRFIISVKNNSKVTTLINIFE